MKHQFADSNAHSSSKLILIITITALLLSSLSFIITLTKKNKLAYVNSAKLMQEYQGVKDAQESLKSKISSYQANIDTLTVELQRDLLDYEKNRSVMSSKEQKTTEDLLSQKRNQLLQYQEAIQQKNQAEDAKVSQEVLGGINVYIQEYGKEHQYQIIFGTTGGNIIYGTEAVDITDEIVKGLNAQYIKK